MADAPHRDPARSSAGGRGRSRDADIDARILAAAGRHLARDGYQGMSLAAVAQEAGTTRQALYRRWAGKAELAAAVVAAIEDGEPSGSAAENGSDGVDRADSVGCGGRTGHAQSPKVEHGRKSAADSADPAISAGPAGATRPTTRSARWSRSWPTSNAESPGRAGCPWSARCSRRPPIPMWRPDTRPG